MASQVVWLLVYVCPLQCPVNTPAPDCLAAAAQTCLCLPDLLCINCGYLSLLIDRNSTKAGLSYYMLGKAAFLLVGVDNNHL